MAAYLIANVKVTDDAWLPDYAANVHDIVHKHGGKYLSRSANITTVEGEAPDTTVIALLQFPSVEAAQAFAKRSGLCRIPPSPSGWEYQQVPCN